MLLAIGALSAPCTAAAQQPSRTVALTFDDLPYANATEAGRRNAARALEANRGIQRPLKRYSIPAVGFVNESKVQALGAPATVILKSWNRGKFELANHGFAHADSNDLSIAGIEQEIDQGERTIKRLTQSAGRKLRWFRFPFNHVGDTEEKRVRAERALAQRGYRAAASTIDTSDYLFDQAYERALTGRDKAMQRKIEQAYLDHTREQIAYYAGLNAKVLGYEPPQVMLLHLNSINGATMDRIVGIFKTLGYRFVTLDAAQADPAYRRSPAVATKFGPMWGYRWARERRIRIDGSLEKEPPQWVADYAAGK
jgi:peptidoglycan/xylan/chitin deacetylase (PgdA/CDA1 family)